MLAPQPEHAAPSLQLPPVFNPAAPLELHQPPHQHYATYAQHYGHPADIMQYQRANGLSSAEHQQPLVFPPIADPAKAGFLPGQTAYETPSSVAGLTSVAASQYQSAAGPGHSAFSTRDRNLLHTGNSELSLAYSATTTNE